MNTLKLPENHFKINLPDLTKLNYEDVDKSNPYHQKIVKRNFEDKIIKVTPNIKMLKLLLN